MECHVELDLAFIDDALTHELNRHLALNEAANESLKQLPCLTLEILGGIRFRPVEASSRVYEDCILVFSGYEAVAYLRVAQQAIPVLVELVENYEHFVLRDRQLQVVYHCGVQIVAVNTALAGIKLAEHFENVAHVEV